MHLTECMIPHLRSKSDPGQIESDQDYDKGANSNDDRSPPGEARGGGLDLGSLDT